MVRVALAGEDATKTYLRFSTSTPILSSEAFARKICVLPESNINTTGTQWMIVLEMTAVFLNASFAVAA